MNKFRGFMNWLSDMRTAVLIAIVLWLLVGCATPQIIYRTAKVPEPPVIEVPMLEPAVTNEEKANALAAYIAKLKSSLMEAVKALDAYRTTSGSSTE